MIDDWSRTAEQIMLSTSESKIRVLAITSALPAAGVSTVASGVAEAFARSGRKTLLLDLTSQIDGRGPQGAWVPGEPVPQESIKLLADGLAHLTVVATTGTRALFSNVELLQKVFQRDLAGYSTIIVDLPAVLDDDNERLNPIAAARAADAVVLVGLTGLTNRAELADATQKLRQVGANLTGMVLNDQYCATLGEEIADVSYNRLGRTFPRLANWIAQKAMSSQYLGRNFRIVR
jgi:polysaccharide biosynthesis transport protein